MASWKWFGDLDDVEKDKAREVLSRHPQYRGRKLAWDGRCLLALIRPPSQFWYLLEEDGSIGPGLQSQLDSGEIIDTKDDGFLMLVRVAE